MVTIGVSFSLQYSVDGNLHLTQMGNWIIRKTAYLALNVRKLVE